MLYLSGRIEKLTAQQWVILAAVLTAVAYIAWQAASATRNNGDATAPPRQPAPDNDQFALVMGLNASPDGYSHLASPADHHAGYTYSCHRYPSSVGGNVTATIHRGWSSMRVPSVQDVQWIISPPSEVMW